MYIRGPLCIQYIVVDVDIYSIQNPREGGPKRGSPLSAFSWVLPCPLNIPETSIVFKVLILVNIQWESKIKDHFSGWIDSSFNLNMLITCFLNVVGSADFFRCRISGDRPPLLQKVRTFGLGPLTGRLCYKKSELLGWDPPTPPQMSITNFNMRCHLT